MKKVVGVLLTLCLLSGILIPKVYCAEESKNVSLEMGNKTVARGGMGDLCYEHVKNIKQTNSYNCGATTVLQTLYGLDSEGAIEGNTDEEKIANLEEICGTNENEGTWVYRMVNALNNYNLCNKVYQSTLGSSLGAQSRFEDYIAVSLMTGKPVVLHALTEYLSYYNGSEYRHYLSLDVFDRRYGTVRIVDCNYMDEYYGIHTVQVSEAYACISASGRYLIH